MASAMPQTRNAIYMAFRPQGFKPLRSDRVTARLKPCPYPKLYRSIVKTR